MLSTQKLQTYTYKTNILQTQDKLITNTEQTKDKPITNLKTNAIKEQIKRNDPKT